MICKKSKDNLYIKMINLDDLDITEDQIIILSVAGSNMYGTATENSDTDFLGIYKPTRRDLFTQSVKHQIHLPKSSGIDLQMWSIHHFLKLACDGETMAIDLLHSPYNCWIYYNPSVWSELQDNRHLFYTKQMNSYISYARTMATKYGIRGNRIKTFEKVIKFLEQFKYPYRAYYSKLKDIWDKLPTGPDINFLDTEPYKMYQVCGKKFQETCHTSYVLDCMQESLTEYGKRAKMAANNKGIDWKGLSHAVRAANQMYDLFKYGEYKYPLKNHKFITMVKEGKIDYAMAEAVLDDFMVEIDRLIETSSLPEGVNQELWANWLLSYIDKEIL